MDSSFHLSEFGQPNSPDHKLGSNEDYENDDLNTEDSVEFLRSKISEVEATLDSVNKDIERRKALYESELTNLAIEIENSKKKYVKDLEQQKREQNEKFEALKFSASEEKERLQTYYNNIIKQNNILKKNHDEVYEIQKQSHEFDAQRSAELESIRSDELEAELKNTQFNNLLKRKLTQFSNKQRLKTLEQEVSNLQSIRREMDSKFRLDRSDLLGRFEIRTSDNKLVINTLKNDSAVRDKDFTQHIKVTKERIDKEKNAAENELKLMARQLETLQDVYQTLLKRGGQQLSIVNQDIEKMKRLLEASNEEVRKFEQENLERNRKFHQLSLSTNSFRQSSSSIADELNRTKMERDFSVSQIQKYSTPKSSRKPMSTYSFSTGKKNSLF